MAPPSRKSQPKNLRNPSSKAAISKGNRRSRTGSSQKLPLQLEDDAPNFPRGGGRSFRKEEKDEIGSILDNEIEADRRSLEKRKKGKKVQKRNQSMEDDLGSLFGDGIKGKLPRFSNRITLKAKLEAKCCHLVKLGMKKSYFKDEETLQMISRQSLDDDVEKNSSMVVAVSKPLRQSTSASIENFNLEVESGYHSMLADFENRALVPPLEVPLDDVETPDNEVDVDHVLNTAADAEIIEEKNKRAKKKARKESIILSTYLSWEQEIRAAEERLLEKDIPESTDEFEILVRSSPNSSFIWIKYTAFMLSLADVEKARSIAERALKTINIREESEKLNIWVAYFNLENAYGNPPEDAVLKIFQRALQYCDPKKVHLALLGMYQRTEQHKLASELLDKMARKFKHSCKVWLSRIQFLLKQNSDGIQSVVNRALLSLPRHKHIKFISQTAILEFKCGVPDRRRSLFEGMLREYPKRTDLWSIYLDQEIRIGDGDVVRALFERAISLCLTPKKMKFLFKKYLEYEKSIGDEERIMSVKKKALDYAESTLA